MNIFNFNRKSDDTIWTQWINSITEQAPQVLNSIVSSVQDHFSKAYHSPKDYFWANRNVCIGTAAGLGAVLCLLWCKKRKNASQKVQPVAANSSPNVPSTAVVLVDDAKKQVAVPAQAQSAAASASGGAAAAAAATALVPVANAPVVVKKGVIMPKVELTTSLGIACLRVEIPPVALPPIQAGIIFIVDVSESMSTTDGRIGENSCTRLEEVEQSIYDVADSFRNFMKENEEHHIEISIVVFNVESAVVLKPTRILKGPNPKREKMFNPNGFTDIPGVLKKSLIPMHQMADHLPNGKQIVIFLTDGDNPITPTDPRILAFKQELGQRNATLVVVGIGKGHNKDSMGILSSKTRQFKGGTYVDTTQPGSSISSAIQEAVQQVVPSFRLHLGIPKSLQGRCSILEQIQQQDWYLLGKSVPHSTTFYRLVKIVPSKVDKPIDLKDTSLELFVKDPFGEEGRTELPWNPTSVIDPKIIHLKDSDTFEELKVEGDKKGEDINEGDEADDEDEGVETGTAASAAASAGPGPARRARS